MEEKGSGIPSMPRNLREYGLKDPGFDYDQGFFVVTLYGRELTPVQLRTSPSILTQLSPRQVELLNRIENQRTMTSEQVAEELNISKETANQDLKKLMQFELVERKGKGPSTHYVLKSV